MYENYDEQAIVPPYNNFLLLQKACLLLQAGNDIICNETGELYGLLQACEDEEKRKRLRLTLEMLHTSIGSAFRIAKMLLRAERTSWEA